MCSGFLFVSQVGIGLSQRYWLLYWSLPKKKSPHCAGFFGLVRGHH